MNRFALLFGVVPTALSGCGGLLGKWELTSGPFVDEKHSRNSELIEVMARDGVQYQIERSGAHPALRWPVGSNRLEAVLNDIADSANYGDMFTLAGYRYVFLKECEGNVKVGDPKYGAMEERSVTLRILELADKETLYVFRDVDLDGNKFKTFVVTASWRKPSGTYSHWIEQRVNEANEIRYCRE